MLPMQRGSRSLMEHGLLRPSFVPPPDVRRLRNLTRYRKTLINGAGPGDPTVGEKHASRRYQAVQRHLGHIVGDISSDHRGDDRLATGSGGAGRVDQGPAPPEDPQIREALVNHIDEHHAAVARCGLGHLGQMDEAIGEVSGVIDAVIEPRRCALELLVTIPGVSTRTAECLIAECESDMTVFPDRGVSGVVGRDVSREQQVGGRTGSGRDDHKPAQDLDPIYRTAT